MFSCFCYCIFVRLVRLPYLVHNISFMAPPLLLANSTFSPQLTINTGLCHSFPIQSVNLNYMYATILNNAMIISSFEYEVAIIMEATPFDIPVRSVDQCTGKECF